VRHLSSTEPTTYEPGACTVPTDRAPARRLVATIVATLLFALAVAVSRTTHLRLPGHSVLFWLPALLVGRSLCGYRGSTMLISVGGALLATAPRVAADGRVVGYLLGALAIEAIMALVQDGPGLLVGMAMGISANLGKLVPKVVTILAVGATPHHTRQTLPFMLVSYITFGALAGLVCTAVSKHRKKVPR